jgi:hypothetical protein
MSARWRKSSWKPWFGGESFGSGHPLRRDPANERISETSRLVNILEKPSPQEFSISSRICVPLEPVHGARNIHTHTINDLHSGEVVGNHGFWGAIPVPPLPIRTSTLVNTTEKVTPPKFSSRVFGSVFLLGSQTFQTHTFPRRPDCSPTVGTLVGMLFHNGEQSVLCQEPSALIPLFWSPSFGSGG